MNNNNNNNNNNKLQEKFGSHARKTFDRFTTKDSYTWNITHNTESTAVWSLKSERWGSLLVQEKCQEEKACDKRHPYKYTPANLLENENFKLYWNRNIFTDKTIHFNRPDITFMNKKTMNIFLIYIAVLNTNNLAKTITDKQNKDQELANEICAMWKQKAAQVIPIVISYTGVIPKSLSQSLTRLNLLPNTYIQLQKSVILGTCWIIRNLLNYK